MIFIAATRLIALHVNKGQTVAQSLQDRVDYATNEHKTDKGIFVNTFGCDKKTIVEEFMLSKRQYEYSTGRERNKGIIGYQIRQSFKPGEITPEEANQVGYETALRFTKGNYAFVVATHTDKAHIHNHIIFNSTNIDGTKKFRNFFYSALAVQRVSDLVCLEHGLSVIKPKPYRERAKRTDYPSRKSQREILCEAIDQCLKEKPKNFEELVQLLRSMGYEFKDGKHPAFKGKDQKKFLRLSSLGEGYGVEELNAVISGKSIHKARNSNSKFQQAPRQFNMLIDIQAKLAEGKNGGYERWAKKFNRKEAAKTVCVLKEKGIENYDDLVALTDKLSSRFSELSDTIKDAEKRIAEIEVLRKHIDNYSHTRDVYAEYRKAGYSKKFYEEHREEIQICKAAKEAFNQLGVKKLPTRKELSMEYAQLINDKKAAYAEYRQVKKDMQEYLIAKQNVEIILGIDRQKKEKEKEEKQR